MKFAPKRRRAPSPSPIAGAEPQWYKNVVIYELHVRSFCDSTSDGVGDFNGLTSKLDYLVDLGVTAVWLLPFYPSPLRDDGYDVADYSGIHPSYGSIDDARRFIDEAHRRGIRVIIEFVVNHTSDQHPWFQRARRAPPGSPERDFYVWSDTPERYAGTRVIFKDFEASNWTWDPVAKQYYWHRFYSHQPDLNFDNPRVHAAVLDVCDFWFRAGVDGMRLDAVPYLYEREGTSCENLPETHAFLKKLRAHVDRHYPNRLLLAEANQWPDDAAAYFGIGDECHMAFHFPLMPRMFMALRMEDRYPILDVLEQTPPIPESCQWALFLRNHDELTLEMVTDEERDYMYRVYASDREARINLGIRRRLAPLLDNNRRKIELMNAILFSLPGTPVIYYGDEIGMGDNVHLGDRDGVRTPMQWSADRNAGFSRANPQRLFLPVIIDPEYHYETVNVESQQANPSSLLWWMKRLIALRRRHAVFGRGEIRFLTPANAKVLAFIRRDREGAVLVVANLSRFVQPVELDLDEFHGWTPVELFGRVRFPVIEDRPYFLSLGPHTFYWFALEPAAPAAGVTVGEAAPCALSISGMGAALLQSGELGRVLARILPDLLPRRRWFASRFRAIRHVRMTAAVPIRAVSRTRAEYALSVVRVEFAEGEPESYVVPLALAACDESLSATMDADSVIATLTDARGERWLLYDAMADCAFSSVLLSTAMRGREIDGKPYRLVGQAIGRTTYSTAQLQALSVHVRKIEQSNTSVVFGERMILKLFRKLDEGLNPEFEIGRHLARRAVFPHAASLLGALNAVAPEGATRTLAVVSEFVPGQGDAWTKVLDPVSQCYESIEAMPESSWSRCITPAAPGLGCPPHELAAVAAELFDTARLLGRRTAELHAALADDAGDPAFSPEPFTLVYQRGLFQSMRNATRATMRALSRAEASLPAAVRASAHDVLARERDILATFHELVRRPLSGMRIRCHGDLHLGQVLWTGRDFVFIDFEGEAARSIGERRLKRSPLRDVAGMIRSIDDAVWTGLRESLGVPPGDPSSADAIRLLRAAELLSGWMAREFLRAYEEGMDDFRPALLPEDASSRWMVLRVWQLERALIEVEHALRLRPDWIEAPLRAIVGLMSASAEGPLSDASRRGGR
ncbi:MAG: maltose alpha-D-glucosyltransferase [Phycisphaerae bacterium]|nr:maltose alpha-D-glucosyltransferase [Phycisphaerae bacterium]